MEVNQIMFNQSTTAGAKPGAIDTNDLIERIRPYATVNDYGPGEKVIVHGQDASALYYVDRGVVEVSYSTNGTKVIVALIGTGEFFGEIGFFDGISRVRDITTTEKSTICTWARENIAIMREKNPGLYADFLFHTAQSICRKFRRLLEEKEPLKAYAASLTEGRQQLFNIVSPIPDSLYNMEVWKEVHSQVEGFKIAMYDLTNSVQMLSRDELLPEHYKKCGDIISSFNNALDQLDKSIEEGKLKNYLMGYIFKEIFPYFMRSRFAQRTYFKPKGYAGDFLMMELIYQNSPEGDGNLGVLIDAYCLDAPASRAVRGRRKALSSLLKEYSAPLIEQGRRVHIMNLACGSNRELFDFIRECPDTSKISALCVDADQDALEYTDRNVNNFDHNATIRLMKDNVVKWAIGRVRHEFGKQDIIYSAGLTDYLDERLFIILLNRIYEFLNPGGIAIICNFADRFPHKSWMDQLLQWKLIYRDEPEMERLFEKSRFGKTIKLFTEEEGITIFAIARKEG